MLYYYRMSPDRAGGSLTCSARLFTGRTCSAYFSPTQQFPLNCCSTIILVLEVALMAETILNVLLVILIIAAVILVVLYFLGSKLQKRQLEQQQLLNAAAQTVSLLVIDKKKLKITQAGLPKMVVDQTPKYMRWTKVPVVKAKIGPKIMTLIADAQVFEALPIKTEAKVVLSGLYITQIKSIRGGSIPAAPKKKGFFARFRKSKNK